MKRTSRNQDLKLLYKINNTIVERNLLKPYQKVLVAVSGGQDSMCIVEILSHLKIKWQWKLGIVHCDHRWHHTSILQAKHVARLAANMQIDYYQPVAIECVTQEAVARNWRYQIIQHIAMQYNYTAIITAHSASDRIETLLYNLIRGTGLQGIRSLSWKRNLSNIRCIPWNIWLNSTSIFWKQVKYHKIDDMILPLETKKSIEIIRPILDITRVEIKTLLKTLKVAAWPDSSNESLRIRRNRIRHRLLPYMRLHYNPCIDQALGRWAEIVYAENLFLDTLTNCLLSQIEMYTNTQISNIYTNSINLEIFRSFPLALQRRVLKLFLYRRTQINLSFRYIEHIRLFVLFSKFSIYKKKFTTNIESLPDSPCIYLPGQGKLLVFDQILLYLA
jgi:tRNA(Ile)-lysidine synthase